MPTVFIVSSYHFVFCLLNGKMTGLKSKPKGRLEVGKNFREFLNFDSDFGISRRSLTCFWW